LKQRPSERVRRSNRWNPEPEACKRRESTTGFSQRKRLSAKKFEKLAAERGKFSEREGAAEKKEKKFQSRIDEFFLFK
jgi:hypothetical protein